jgi:hypothetical protein
MVKIHGDSALANVLSEGFDDDGEAGAGEKLLGLL